jgi:methyl-accepting chemotaxis protein
MGALRAPPLDLPAAADGRAVAYTFARSQLSRVIQFTEESALAMLVSLRAVEQQVRGLAQHAGEAHVALARALRDYRDGYSHTAERFRSLRARRAARVEAQRVALAHIDTLIAEVHATLEESEALADRTRLLAFNARIEAARQVLDARSFTVVAHEMHALSIESARRAGVVRERIEALSDTLRRSLQERLTLDGEAAHEEGDLLQALDGSLDRLCAIEREVFDAQDLAQQQVAARAHESAEALRAAVGGMQFQDIVRQSLERVVATVDGLRAHDDAVQEARAAGRPPPPMPNEDLARNSTMQSQHEDYADAVGLDAPAAGPAIELF